MKPIERVVFFQPRTLACDNYSNSAGTEQRWVPWSALVLAPIVLRAGLQFTVIDARVYPHTWTRQMEHVTEGDVLALSVMTGHAIRDAMKASQIGTEQGAKVIWGGPHVTLFPQQTLQAGVMDAILPGFGYKPLADLISMIKQQQWPAAHSDSIYVKTDLSSPAQGSMRRNASISEHIHPPSLDAISDWNPYLNSDVAIASRTVNFITSEGCERKCNFCSEPQTSQSIWLTRDIESSVSVAQLLVEKAGANGLKLHDPNFFHDMDRALAFARLFSKSVGLPWAATIHPADLNAVSESVLDELADSGLVRVLVGLESPDSRLVRLSGKAYDPATIPHLVRKLAAARIRGMFTFIVGWPDASAEHYEKTIACAYSIREIWSEHQAKIHFLEPWPGTPIFTLLVRRGFKQPSTLAEWADIDYYLARHSLIHDPNWYSRIRESNEALSPYVNA